MRKCARKRAKVSWVTFRPKIAKAANATICGSHTTAKALSHTSCPNPAHTHLARAPLPRYQLYSGTTSAKSTKSGFHGGVLRQPGRPIGPREAQEIEIGSIESDEKRPKFFRRHSPSHGSRIRLNGRFVSSPLAVEGQAQHRVEDCSLHNR